MTEAQKRALALKEDIEKACVRHNLNLTIHEGKIGFVDQKAKKIVMVWNAEYSAKDIKKN